MRLLLIFESIFSVIGAIKYHINDYPNEVVMNRLHMALIFASLAYIIHKQKPNNNRTGGNQ